MRKSLGSSNSAVKVVVKRNENPYETEPFSGSTVLFKSAIPLPVEDKETYGWHRYVSGNLEVCEIPGEHGSITKEPNAGLMADRIREKIGNALNT